MRGMGEGECAPEGCGLDDDLDVPRELTGPSEGLVNLYGVVHVAVGAKGGCHLVGLAFFQIPGRGTRGSEYTSGCGMGLSGRAQRSRWIVGIGAPGVASNEYVWRIHVWVNSSLSPSTRARVLRRIRPP